MKDNNIYDDTTLWHKGEDKNYIKQEVQIQEIKF